MRRYKSKNKSAASKELEIMAKTILAFFYVVSAIILILIIINNIDMAEWQRKIRNDEVSATTATVISRQLVQRNLSNMKTGRTRTDYFCSYTYRYVVNGVSYEGSELTNDVVASPCGLQEIAPIQVYFVPQNPGKAISVMLAKEGNGEPTPVTPAIRR